MPTAATPKVRQRGASLVEFAVALPALLLLGLGTLQGALAYHAKTTLNYAAFEAARKGAVNHAQSEPMREELGIRMAPIYGGDGSPEKALAAITRASLEANDPRLTHIDILNPTVEAFIDHGEDNPEAGVREIPNSHLRYRSREVKSASGVNIQDANLLKIKVTHGFKLKVPLIDKVVSAVLLRTDPANAQFYSMRRIPITAVATVRMQSPAWPDNNWHAGGEAGSGQVPPRPPQDNLNPETGQSPGDSNPEDSDTGNQSNTGTGNNGEDPNTEEVECESTWDDERYQAKECTGRWYCFAVEFTEGLKAAANVIWDFVAGAVAGLGDQVKDLWELLKSPGVLKDLAEAFIKDPKGTLQAIVEDVGEDVEKVLNCGPKDLGRIVGQNVNPMTPVRVLSKLAKVTGNNKLLQYAKDLEKRIDCASFPAGTPIWTPTGQLDIEQIVKGTLVHARDEDSFISRPQPVTALHGRTAPGYQRIETEKGVIKATPEHPFWIQGKGWVEAKDLEWEDPIATVHGDVVSYQNEYIDQPIQVHNFTVANTHNYFAGKMGAWVHNANCRGTLDGNSQTLKNRLDPDGLYPRDGTWAAHHLIPTAQAKNSKALQAAVDANVYDQNSVFNGILLPTKQGATVPDGVNLPENLPIHKSGHTGSGTGLVDESYQQYTKAKLDDLDRRYQDSINSGQKWSDERLAREIQKVQEGITSDLMNGNVTLCKSGCEPQSWQ